MNDEVSAQDHGLQLAMQVLPRRRAGHLLVAHKRKRARTLVAGHARLAPFVQAGFIRRRPVPQDNNRVNALPPLVVRQTDNGYVLNRRISLPTMRKLSGTATRPALAAAA